MESVSVAPNALLEVMDSHHRVHATHRLIGAGARCKIGRALTCDIVLDDPYAAAEHTELILRDDGLLDIVDLGSRNGTRVDGERHHDRAPPRHSGELIVGRSRVRVRTARAPLEPEKVFRRDVLQRHRTTLALVGLALACAFIVFNLWLTAAKELPQRILVGVTIGLGVIGIWTLLWGLITRIGHGAWSLRTHTAIAANACAVALWLIWLTSAATFATQWSWLWYPAALMIAALLMGALFLHLRKATHLGPRTAALAAIGPPLVLAIGAAWAGLQAWDRDVNRLTLGPDVLPQPWHLSSSTSLDTYVDDAIQLKREANRKRQQSLTDRPLVGGE